jgi:hypothetical protein
LKNLNLDKSLDGVIVVYGKDGNRSVFSVGEVVLSKDGVILANRSGGLPIKRDGKFIIVPPNDTSAERLVKAVSEIKLVFSLERATKFS